MDSVEVPQYFICPISLQIMKDPVTAATGITYDRDSIERWLFVDNNATCPVTNQPLPRDSDLTPNHTLRRLIQAWCTVNASPTIGRIPTPKTPVSRAGVLGLLHDLSAPRLQLNTLKLIATLASDNESNRRCMLQSGVANHLIRLIVSCSKKGQADPTVAALAALQSLRVPPDELKPLAADNSDLVESLTWVLQHEDPDTRSTTILALNPILEATSHNVLERLKLNFFEAVTRVLHDRISPRATKAALQALLRACQCPLGRNRAKIVEAGAAAELIELELGAPDKRTSELALGVLDHLCACADGRAQLVGHAAGIAVVSKRILRISPAVDDRAVTILASLCQYSATSEVLQEMLRVGAVSKLCFLLQADCSSNVREKARWILRLHWGAWRDSPCIDDYLLSRYP